MDEKTLFINFWEKESGTTQRVLERIPEGPDYRPDPKSRTAKEIAWQMVCEERLIIEAAESGTGEFRHLPTPGTMQEVCEAYAAHREDIVKRWKALSADRWSGTMHIFGHDFPTSAMAWTFLFDLIHHRGQISTYLRPMGAKVPQIYGPSGDEP